MAHRTENHSDEEIDIKIDEMLEAGNADVHTGMAYNALGLSCMDMTAFDRLHSKMYVSQSFKYIMIRLYLLFTEKTSMTACSYGASVRTP